MYQWFCQASPNVTITNEDHISNQRDATLQLITGSLYHTQRIRAASFE